MISINSLPPEVTEIIIREIATSGEDEEEGFEIWQLALTARISPNWTYASQMIMHSNLEFYDDEEVNEWLECGIAGKFKTKSLGLRAYMEEATVKKVMNAVIGLENLILDLYEGDFDMKLLQGERFSDLTSFESKSNLSYVGYGRGAFKFRLESLVIHQDRAFSQELFAALISPAKETLHTLDLTWDPLVILTESILKLEEVPRIKSLYLHSSAIPTLAPLRELEIFHTTTGNDDDELDHLESILSTILPDQLKDFKIILESGGQIEEEELESVERMMKLPGLNRLQKIRIDYEGQELDEMTLLQAEWESRGIEVNFWTGEVLFPDDSDEFADDYDSREYGSDRDYNSDYSY